MDYTQILPQLVLGSCPRSTADIDRLRQETGVTAVLNLQTDEDFWAIGLPWKKLEAHYAGYGVKVKRVPVKDFNEADLTEKLPNCARTLYRLLAAGHAVYLHCTAGAGRAPTVAIAYLAWCSGWKLEEAAEYVTQQHPCSPNLEAIRQSAWDCADVQASSPTPSPEHHSENQ